MKPKTIEYGKPRKRWGGFHVQKTRRGEFLIYKYSSAHPPIGRTFHEPEIAQIVRAERLKQIAERPAIQARIRIANIVKKLVEQKPTLRDRQIAYQQRMRNTYSDICGAGRRAAAVDRHLGRLSETVPVGRLFARKGHQADRWADIRAAEKLYWELSDSHYKSRLARESGNAQAWEREIIVCEELLDRIEALHVL